MISNLMNEERGKRKKKDKVTGREMMYVVGRKGEGDARVRVGNKDTRFNPLFFAIRM